MEDTIKLYNDLAARAWSKMTELVGVHTVMILLQRALWMTAQKYEEAERIVYNESGIDFSGLHDVSWPLAKEIMEEFFASMVTILTRLLGKDIAAKLAREFDILLVQGWE